MKKWVTKSGYEIIQVLSGRSNVFLLTNREMNILIDTSPKYRWNKLEKRLNELNINNIEYLILTHTHFDHASNAFTIKEKFKSKVIIHKDESEYLIKGENIIPQGTNIVTKWIVNKFAKSYLKGVSYHPCQYDILVDSVYDLKDLGFNALIIYTPGHTLGSISIIVDDEIAIVGDAMFGIIPWSVFPPYGCDIKKMVNSWGKLLETNCTLFIPAHGSENKRKLVQREFKKKINLY